MGSYYEMKGGSKMARVIEACRQLFDQSTEEERDKYAEKAPRWLHSIRKDVYIDKSGKVAYRSQEPSRPDSG